MDRPAAARRGQARRAVIVVVAAAAALQLLTGGLQPREAFVGVAVPALEHLCRQEMARAQIMGRRATVEDAMPEPGSEDDLDPRKVIRDDGVFPSGKRIEDVMPADEAELIREGEFERSKPMSAQARKSIEELEEAKRNRPRVCKFKGCYYMVDPVGWTYEKLPDHKEDAKDDRGPMTGEWNRAFRQPQWLFKRAERKYRAAWQSKRRKLRRFHGRGQRWNNGKYIHLAKLQGSPFTREKYGDKYFGKAPWTNHPNEIAIQAPVFVPTADQWYYGEKVMRLKPNRPHPHKRRIAPNKPFMSTCRLLTKVRPARFFQTLNPW